MAIKLRPEVRRFAEQMELKLRENDHKGGWLDEHIYWLIQRIGDEHKELIEAVLFKTDDVHAIIKECADVANFAMMVADVVHRYGVQNSVPTPFAPEAAVPPCRPCEHGVYGACQKCGTDVPPLR